MNKLPKQVYTKEFRENAVKLVVEERLKVPEAARRLSMSSKTHNNKEQKVRPKCPSYLCFPIVAARPILKLPSAVHVGSHFNQLSKGGRYAI